MLGVLAAIALVVGGVGTAMVVAEGNGPAAEQNRTPVVEVQAVQNADASKAK